MKARHALLGSVLLGVACSDDSEPLADDSEAASEMADSAAADESTQADESAAGSLPSAAGGTETSQSTDLVALPEREGPRRETTYAVPHIQIDAELVPEVDAELRRRVFSLPGVEDQESALSLPGARSLWLADDVELARPEVILSGREFGHFHPNGSLHLMLPVDRAKEVAVTKWGELHPWVGREDFWDGMVMLYTPETLDEIDVAMLLIVDAYNFVTGANLDPADFD